MHTTRLRRTAGTRDGRSWPRWARILLVCSVSFLAMMSYVWKQIKINQLAKEVNTLKRHQEQLVNDTKTLQMEVASLSRLSRIGEIAMQELKMQYPDQYPVVFKLNPADQDNKTMISAVALGRVRKVMDYAKTLLLPTAEAGAPRWE